jgi:phospholipase C
MASSPVQRIFVLVLENRSFDHLSGFSGITGIDAVTENPHRSTG